MRAEHTDSRGTQREHIGSPRPHWFDDKWKLSRWRIHLSQAEDRSAFCESRCHRAELEGGDAG